MSIENKSATDAEETPGLFGESSSGGASRQQELLVGAAAIVAEANRQDFGLEPHEIEAMHYGIVGGLETTGAHEANANTAIVEIIDDKTIRFDNETHKLKKSTRFVFNLVAAIGPNNKITAKKIRWMGINPNARERGRVAATSAGLSQLRGIFNRKTEFFECGAEGMLPANGLAPNIAIVDSRNSASSPPNLGDIIREAYRRPNDDGDRARWVAASFHRFAAQVDTSDLSWRHEGLCMTDKQMADTFFAVPEDPYLDDRVSAAKAVCAECPVCQECLDYALANRVVDGVWGGTSDEERKRVFETMRPGNTQSTNGNS